MPNILVSEFRCRRKHMPSLNLDIRSQNGRAGVLMMAVGGYMHYYITKQPRLNSCAIKNISKYIFYRITLSVLSVYAVVCCAVVCTGACALLPWLQLEPLNVSRSTQVSGYGYPSATRRKQYMKTKKNNGIFGND